MSALNSYRSRAGSRLFVIYAVASLIPVLVLGVVLSGNYRREGRDRALGQGSAQAAVIEQMAIAPVLGKRDLRDGLNAAERNGLLQATELAIFSDSIVRLRVRSFEGRVVFSDDGSSAGALPTTDAAFRLAAAGGRDVAIVDGPAGGARVIRVVQPIVPNATGRATGVLEVYLPYAAIAAKVDAQLHRAYVRLAGVLGALYLILALISWSTTRRLRRHAAEREYEALHDALTDLPNREWFRGRAERAVRDAADRGERGAVVLLDLDRFKEVNDTLGHHAGDELLQVVARRLTEAMRTDDIVARLGGDEFGLVLPGLADAGQALELLGAVRARLAADLTLESVEVGIEASFGVALYPEHGTTVEELLKRADAAMYQGKRGATGVVVHDPTGSAPLGETQTTLAVHGELRHALERDELVLHYQPKLDLARETICGVEALLRWQHPQRGLLAPAAFLPAAERSSLIQPLTEWVLRRALSDHAAWQAAGVTWPVSVNVSARNLEAPGFPDLILGVLAETATPVEQVVLEVTETALASDARLAGEAVAALAQQGVAISIDDFGIGSTSLSGLRTLPVAELKIDRAFVMGLDHSEQDRSIVRSVIELGHGLGCSVTAEGVETAATAQWLRRASCDFAQGYHFARPAPWRDLLAHDASAAPTTSRIPA
jgi:diguanylate cyclase (GGDEF)-like protein